MKYPSCIFIIVFLLQQQVACRSLLEFRTTGDAGQYIDVDGETFRRLNGREIVQMERMNRDENTALVRLLPCDSWTPLLFCRLLSASPRSTLSLAPIWQSAIFPVDDVIVQVEYRIVCADNFFGPQCDVFCEPHDDDSAHFICGSHGERRCLPGWKGANCDQALPSCSLAPCQNGGTCRQLNNGAYGCTCTHDFYGKNCQTRNLSTSATSTTEVPSTYAPQPTSDSTTTADVTSTTTPTISTTERETTANENTDVVSTTLSITVPTTGKKSTTTTSDIAEIVPFNQHLWNEQEQSGKGISIFLVVCSLSVFVALSLTLYTILRCVTSHRCSPDMVEDIMEKGKKEKKGRNGDVIHRSASDYATPPLRYSACPRRLSISSCPGGDSNHIYMVPDPRSPKPYIYMSQEALNV